ncbi:hypothetical protein STFR1_50254 [Bacillus vallismortis]
MPCQNKPTQDWQSHVGHQIDISPNRELFIPQYFDEKRNISVHLRHTAAFHVIVGPRCIQP